MKLNAGMLVIVAFIGGFILGSHEEKVFPSKTLSRIIAGIVIVMISVGSARYDFEYEKKTKALEQKKME